MQAGEESGTKGAATSSRETRSSKTTSETESATGARETTTKADVIGQYRRHDGDNGSSEVQVALLTQRIRHLTDHLKRYPKDHATRRGLLQMVGRRAGLLRYLARTEPERYTDVIQRLGIRR
jgi:small subunit ribosomal protein S15